MTGSRKKIIGKKGACALLAMAFVAVALSVSASALFGGDNASAVTFTEDKIEYTLTDIPERTAKVLGYENGIMAANIPSSINNGVSDYKVTSIGDYAFDDCISLKSISIPDSVRSIGENAFRGCISLKSISIPSSVTSIGDYAFENCVSLAEINADPTNPNYISVDGILYDNPITEPIACPMAKVGPIIIPQTVTQISSGFQGCAYIVSVSIPENVTHIEEYAFRGCASLAEINVDSENPNYASADGVLYSKDMTALIACPGARTSLEIPDGVTSIGNGAFSRCTSLASVKIPDGVTSISGYAFSGCTSLESVTIPSGVITISDEAFSGCTSLKSAIFPEGLETIGENVFASCTSLSSVSIPKSVTSIGNGAFFRCTSLTEISVDMANPNYTSIDGVLYNDTKTKLIVCPGGKAGTVEIPGSVTSIGSSAFEGCASLTGINVDPANLNYVSIGGILYNDTKTQLIACPEGKAGAVEIPNTVTNVDGNTFGGCLKLTAINAEAGSASYSSAGGNLFNADGTKLIACPGGLVSVTLPSKVTSIGSGAFQTTLAEINVEDWNTVYRSFDGILYSKDMKTIELCPWGRTAPVVIPSGMEIIHHRALSESMQTTSITFPSTIVTMPQYYFGEITFYDSDGKTLLLPIAESIAGRTFAVTQGKMVLQTETADAGAQHTSTMAYVGIAAAAVAAIAVAAVMADYFFLRRR